MRCRGGAKGVQSRECRVVTGLNSLSRFQLEISSSRAFNAHVDAPTCTLSRCCSPGARDTFERPTLALSTHNMLRQELRSGICVAFSGPGFQTTVAPELVFSI